mmetsp:Transcript_41342/g.86782  ORF Transcript_41342/g.86782 Transcript_41342/m.86782 type:complete len:424 (-) Transcript_41342:51-1322(-)
MQPREFSLGSNPKILHAQLPPTLPADVSGMAATTRKRGNNAHNDGINLIRGGSGDKIRITKENQNITRGERGSFSNLVVGSLDAPRRSSMYSGLSSVTMGRISEEETTGSSSGVSSTYSKPLLAPDEIAGDDTVEDIIASALELGDICRDFQSDEGARKSDKQATAAPATPRAMIGSEVQVLAKKSINGSNGEETEGSASDPDAPHHDASLPLDKDDACNILRHFSNHLTTNNKGDLQSSINAQDEESVSVISDEHQSSDEADDESSDGFLSWDESRRSGEYLDALNQLANQELAQEQHEHSSPLPQKQLSPLQQQHQEHQQKQESHHVHQSPQPTNTQSYMRRGSQESNKSTTSHHSHRSNISHSHSPTSFRPMLPRELLLENDLRTKRTTPLPALPADSSSPSYLDTFPRRSGRGSNALRC